jgi:hypothetical protein
MTNDISTSMNKNTFEKSGGVLGLMSYLALSQDIRNTLSNVIESMLLMQP